MSEKHFTLDIDPDRLRTVAGEIEELRDHLETKGTRTRTVPDDVGDAWTGETAIKVKGEMRALGRLMKSTLSGELDPLPEAIRTLARQFDCALEELPGLNRRWQDAEDTYDEAVTAADRSRQRSLDTLSEQGPVNRFFRHELDTRRTNALSAASGTKSTTQNGLEDEYDAIIERLRGQIGVLSTALSNATPVDVSAEKIEDWRNGEYTDVDRSSLLLTLSLTRQRDEEIEFEEQTAEAEEDLNDLYAALSDNDTDAVAAALEEIGSQSENGIYSEAFVQLIGPENLRALYREINQRANDNQIQGPELYDDVAALSDTVAHGISRTDSAQFTAFYRAFSEEQRDARILALIAASDHADGRLNTAALSVHRPALSYPISMDSDEQFFIMALQEAYDGDNLGTDAVAQWVERSDASDLAEVLKGLEPGDEVSEFMHGFNPNDVSGSPGSPGAIGDDIPKELADRYGQVLVMLKNEHLAEEAFHDPDLLLQLLNERDALSTAGADYFPDELNPHLREVVEDPEFTSWYLDKLGSPGVSRAELQGVLRESEADVEGLISGIVSHRLGEGQDPDAVARSLGNMLRADDLAGEEVDYSGVIESLAEDGISLLADTPVTGPVLGIFSAIRDEQDRIDELMEDASEDERQARQQEMMAFQLYVSVNGEPPPGFNDYLDDYPDPEDPEAILDWVDEMRNYDKPGWEELEGYIDQINAGRDDT